MKVPFNYLPHQFRYTKQYFAEWKKLIRSCEFTLGPYVAIINPNGLLPPSGFFSVKLDFIKFALI